MAKELNHSDSDISATKTITTIFLLALLIGVGIYWASQLQAT